MDRHDQCAGADSSPCQCRCHDEPREDGHDPEWYKAMKDPDYFAPLERDADDAPSDEEVEAKYRAALLLAPQAFGIDPIPARGIRWHADEPEPTHGGPDGNETADDNPLADYHKKRADEILRIVSQLNLVIHDLDCLQIGDVDGDISPIKHRIMDAASPAINELREVVAKEYRKHTEKNG
jgi:hypothetical protein